MSTVWFVVCVALQDMGSDLSKCDLAETICNKTKGQLVWLTQKPTTSLLPTVQLCQHVSGKTSTDIQQKPTET